ncbi:hypothetical protein CRG98_011787 [Punica granatum]|uniref:Uncharacterized protein n=1 Tax=Punica granatum TaxID=22663 RepID=A0A2I0KH56_PUNGR|nr:hypothetical protein CRG98_011787 [Punica granatum]
MGPWVPWDYVRTPREPKVRSIYPEVVRSELSYPDPSRLESGWSDRAGPRKGLAGPHVPGQVSGDTGWVMRQTGSDRLGWTRLGWTCANRRKMGRAREREDERRRRRWAERRTLALRTADPASRHRGDGVRGRGRWLRAPPRLRHAWDGLHGDRDSRDRGEF